MPTSNSYPCFCLSGSCHSGLRKTTVLPIKIEEFDVSDEKCSTKYKLNYLPVLPNNNRTFEHLSGKDGDDGTVD
jgi:hypothetical protein